MTQILIKVKITSVLSLKQLHYKKNMLASARDFTSSSHLRLGEGSSSSSYDCSLLIVTISSDSSTNWRLPLIKHGLDNVQSRPLPKILDRVTSALQSRRVKANVWNTILNGTNSHKR